MKLGPAIHNAYKVEIKDGNFVKGIDRREVRIMAFAEGYAMVRRKGAMPYVASIKELEQRNRD